MMADPKRARNRKRGNKPRIDPHITAPVFYSTKKWLMVARHLLILLLPLNVNRLNNGLVEFFLRLSTQGTWSEQ